MQTVYHTIRWKNLLSSGNAWITVQLDKNPMTLIVGKNGHGKSTILDALCFVLFNRAFRTIKKGQLVNTINRKDCVVELALSSGGDDYVVRRGIKPNIFEIYKNKVLIEQNSDLGDYEEILQTVVIGSSYKTFCQVNILGSARYVPFMELDARDRRKVVEDLLDSQVYGVMLQLAKDKQTALNKSYKELQDQIDVQSHKIETQKKLIARQESDLESRKAETLQQHEAVTQQMKDVYAPELEENLHKLAIAEQNLSEWGYDSDKLVEMRRVVSVKIGALEIRLSDLDAEKINVTGICRTCKQPIDEDHITHNNSAIELDKAKFQAELVPLKERDKKLLELMREYAELQNQLHHKKLNADEAGRVFQYHGAKAISLEVEYQKLCNTKLVEVDLNELTEMQAVLTELNDQSDALTQRISVVKKAIILLADDGIKAKLVNKYIPMINKTLNEWLERLNLFVSFELDEQFNETIKSRHRDEFSYSSFSEGEKLRIDLAILFTWRQVAKLRNSVSSNILIMDEILDRSLDDDGNSDFLEMIKALTGTQNTFIISHNKSVIDSFENVIKAEKNGNFTEYSFSST